MNKTIPVYVYQGCFVIEECADDERRLLRHITGGACAFERCKLQEMQYLAEAHGWRIEVTNKPKK